MSAKSNCLWLSRRSSALLRFCLNLFLLLLLRNCSLWRRKRLLSDYELSVLFLTSQRIWCLLSAYYTLLSAIFFLIRKGALTKTSGWTKKKHIALWLRAVYDLCPANLREIFVAYARQMHSRLRWAAIKHSNIFHQS